MAEERNTESFALGLIVAALVFLLLRREFAKRAALAETGGETSRGGGAAAPAGGGSCGCGGHIAAALAAPGSPSNLPSNPGISIGGQSYNPGASFPATGVVTRYGSGHGITTYG